MTDFVIVVAALASLASAAPSTQIPAPATQPIVGFHTYATADDCEGAAAAMATRPGTRLVCLPVEQHERNDTN